MTDGPSSEDGFSLVEMMVTVALLMLVAAIVLPSILVTQRAVATADQRITDLGQAQIGVSAVTRAMRAAIHPPGEETTFLVARPDEVELYSNIGSGAGEAPARVRIRVVNGPSGRELVQTVTAGRYTEIGGSNRWATNPAVPVQTRTLARGLAAGTPVFTYHPSAVPSAIVTPAPGNVAQLNTIRMVTVEFTIESAQLRSAGDTQVRQRIRLPNLTS